MAIKHWVGQTIHLSQTPDINEAYLALEKAELEFNAAQQKLFSAQALCNELYKNSDPYKIQLMKRWDNRCEEDG